MRHRSNRGQDGAIVLRLLRKVARVPRMIVAEQLEIGLNAARWHDQSNKERRELIVVVAVCISRAASSIAKTLLIKTFKGLRPRLPLSRAFAVRTVIEPARSELERRKERRRQADNEASSDSPRARLRHADVGLASLHRGQGALLQRSENVLATYTTNERQVHASRTCSDENVRKPTCVWSEYRRKGLTRTPTETGRRDADVNAERPKADAALAGIETGVRTCSKALGHVDKRSKLWIRKRR